MHRVCATSGCPQWLRCLQHFVDLSTYELDMVRRFDLSCHLDGQPLQFMMKDR